MLNATLKQEEYQLFVNSLVDEGYRYHHCAKSYGYLSRRVDAAVEEYAGRFGRGYKVHRPDYYCTGFHWVEYWVKED